MLTFAVLFTAALGLPLALWLAASRHTQQALALTVFTCGLFASALGLWLMRDSTVVQSVAPNDAAYHDTYYVIVHSTNLRNLGLVYLLVAAGLAIVARLGNHITRRLTLPGFAAFHLGASLAILLTLAPPLAMPRRHIDDPDWFQTMTLLSSLAALLIFLSLAALTLLLLASLVTALRRPPAL